MRSGPIEGREKSLDSENPFGYIRLSLGRKAPYLTQSGIHEGG